MRPCVLACAALLIACAHSSATDGAATGGTVTLRISTDPERPAIIEAVEPGGSRRVCDRAPCAATFAKGAEVRLSASLGGGAGELTVVADGDKEVAIPLHPAGLPPRPGQ
jgi:hypothetical protein